MDYKLKKGDRIWCSVWKENRYIRKEGEIKYLGQVSLNPTTLTMIKVEGFKGIWYGVALTVSHLKI